MQFVAVKQLTLLKDYVGQNHSKYILIADKIAEQLIESSQLYHRICHLSEYDVTTDCVKLAETALEYACSSLVKDNIRTAVEEIKRIKGKIPPKRIFNSALLINKKIAEYSSKVEKVETALSFIGECAPTLVKLKDELGTHDQEYIKLSTKVAEFALNMTIGYFNKEMKAFDLLIRCRPQLPSLFQDFPSLYQDNVMSSPEVKQAFVDIKNLLFDCCQLFANLDLLDVSKDWEPRYLRNKTAIVKDAKELEVNTIHKPTIDMRTEQEIFSEAQTIVQLQEYLSKYGQVKAKFYKQASDKITALRKEEEKDHKYWNWVNQNKKYKGYKSYLAKYPKGLHADEAKVEIKKKDEIAPLKEFLYAVLLIISLVGILFVLFT